VFARHDGGLDDLRVLRHPQGHDDDVDPVVVQYPAELVGGRDLPAAFRLTADSARS
jgi:hypothetical protein